MRARPGWAAALSLVAGMSLSMAPFAAHADNAEPPELAYPMEKGTYWIYEGPTTWTQATPPRSFQRVLRCRMEIVDVIKQADLVVAVIKGHPIDLAWYEEGKAPGDYLLVRLPGEKYYLIRGDRVAKVLEQLDSGAELEGIVQEYELFLDLPLEKGARFGQTTLLTRSDYMYSWFVEEGEPVLLAGVRGIDPSAPRTLYDLVYRSWSEHILIDFVPGIGIVNYIYSHHGSASETHLKLIEYHPGQH